MGRKEKQLTAASIEAAVCLQRPGQSLQILLTWNFNGAKLLCGGGEHLDVEELVAASLQVFSEVAEGSFPGISDAWNMDSPAKRPPVLMP